MFNYSKSELTAAHKLSIANRSIIESSKECGCFYCNRIFPAPLVSNWTKEKEGKNDTGWCPNCNIDSLIGDASVIKLSNEFLFAMNKQYFDGLNELENANSFEELIRLI
jgi:hypothetical protein